MFSLERYLKRLIRRTVKLLRATGLNSILTLKVLIRRTSKIALLGKYQYINGYVRKRKILTNDKFEHREVAEKILGRKLREWEEVHHIDFVRDNNDPSNLCVMSKRDHVHYHNWHRWIAKNKPDIELTIEYRKSTLKRKWDCILLEEYS